MNLKLRARRLSYWTFHYAGVDPRVIVRNLIGLPGYVADLAQFRRAAETSDFPRIRLFPYLGQKNSGNGDARHQYFFQDLLVAQKIFARNPVRHIDIGSRVDGFVAHVASFRQIELLDVRPTPLAIRNVIVRQCDLTQPLSSELRGVTDSVSCLHALEHFGLGRYGDPLNPNGHRLGLQAMQEMLLPGGRLYLSVPIGEQCVRFNAHRVFGVDFLFRLVSSSFTVDDVSIIDDECEVVENVPPDPAYISQNIKCSDGLAILELVKHR